MSVGFVNNAFVMAALLFGIGLAWLCGILGAVAGGVVIWIAGLWGIWMIDTTIGYDGLGAILWPIFGLPMFIVGLTPIGLLGAQRANHRKLRRKMPTSRKRSAAVGIGFAIPLAWRIAALWLIEFLICGLGYVWESRIELRHLIRFAGLPFPWLETFGPPGRIEIWSVNSWTMLLDAAILLPFAIVLGRLITSRRVAWKVAKYRRMSLSMMRPGR